MISRFFYIDGFRSVKSKKQMRKRIRRKNCRERTSFGAFDAVSRGIGLETSNREIIITCARCQRFVRWIYVRSFLPKCCTKSSIKAWKRLLITRETEPRMDKNGENLEERFIGSWGRELLARWKTKSGSKLATMLSVEDQWRPSGKKKGQYRTVGNFPRRTIPSMGGTGPLDARNSSSRDHKKIWARLIQGCSSSTGKDFGQRSKIPLINQFENVSACIGS